MRIRRFRKSDAQAAAEIIRTCFLTLDLGGHSPEGVALQVASNTPEKLIAKAEKYTFFVAIEGAEVLGIGGYGEGKVRKVFVNPTLHRKGVGTRIVKRVLAEAERNGERRLECWSTFLAEPFYSELGFTRDGLVEFPSLRLVRMVMDLLGDGGRPNSRVQRTVRPLRGRPAADAQGRWADR